MSSHPPSRPPPHQASLPYFHWRKGSSSMAGDLAPAGHRSRITASSWRRDAWTLGGQHMGWTRLSVPPPLPSSCMASHSISLSLALSLSRTLSHPLFEQRSLIPIIPYNIAPIHNISDPGQPADSPLNLGGPRRRQFQAHLPLHCRSKSDPAALRTSGEETTLGMTHEILDLMPETHQAGEGVTGPSDAMLTETSAEEWAPGERPSCQPASTTPRSKRTMPKSAQLTILRTLTGPRPTWVPLDGQATMSRT
jgi:hypothetical protein